MQDKFMTGIESNILKHVWNKLVGFIFETIFENFKGSPTNYFYLPWLYLFNILVNLCELEILPRALIKYHKRKLFIGHERDFSYLYDFNSVRIMFSQCKDVL